MAHLHIRKLRSKEVTLVTQGQINCQTLDSRAPTLKKNLGIIFSPQGLTTTVCSKFYYQNNNNKKKLSERGRGREAKRERERERSQRCGLLPKVSTDRACQCSHWQKSQLPTSAEVQGCVPESMTGKLPFLNRGDRFLS